MLSWTNVIKSLFISLMYFLKFKCETHFYTIQREHADKIKTWRNEIEKLRNSGGTDNALAADKLLRLIQEEKRVFDHISTSYTSFRAWDPSSNSRGDIQSPE
jgi:hypothetical protein